MKTKPQVTSKMVVEQIKSEVVPNKKRNIISWGLFAVIILAAIVGVLITYWQFYPYQPLIIKNSPLSLISNSKVHQGDMVIFDANFCKNVRVDDYIERQLVGERSVITLPVTISSVPLGCQEVPTTTLLPKTLSNGTYHIHYRVSYQVNPIKVVVVEFDTASFSVVN